MSSSKKNQHNNSAIKYDDEKVRMDLLPTKALEEIAKVFTYGAQKYEPYNWANGDGLAYHRLYGATLRHLNAFWSGENIDESGYHHLAHAGCNIMMLLSLIMQGGGIDDRYIVAQRLSDDINNDNNGISIISHNSSINYVDIPLKNKLLSHIYIHNIPLKHNERIVNFELVSISGTRFYKNGKNKEERVTDSNKLFCDIKKSDIIPVINDNKYIFATVGYTGTISTFTLKVIINCTTGEIIISDIDNNLRLDNCIHVKKIEIKYETVVDIESN